MPKQIDLINEDIVRKQVRLEMQLLARIPRGFQPEPNKSKPCGFGHYWRTYCECEELFCERCESWFWVHERDIHSGGASCVSCGTEIAIESSQY
jgi:hypothetical protein